MALEARKENKVYKIDEASKQRYLMEGFDVYDENGIVEYSPLKTIRYNDHLKIVNELMKENQDLKAKLALLEVEKETDKEAKEEKANKKK